MGNIMENASATTVQQKKRFYFDFVGNRHIAYIISIITLVLGIGSIAIKGGFNLGIEFSGGTMVQVRFSELPEVQNVRNILENAGYKQAVIQRLGDEHSVVIRVPNEEVKAGQQATVQEDLSKKIVAALQAGLGSSNMVKLDQVEQVGPQVGSELRRSAQLSILFAFAGMAIYIAWRFGSKVALPILVIGLATIWLSSWNIALSALIVVALIVLLLSCVVWGYYFAFAAVISLVHDIFVTAGAISLTNRELTLTVIAALLTLIGYSINDTIVIFDRIRENLRLMKGKPTKEILNDSMNQTLTRTILTSTTAFLVVLVMLFMGGQALDGFSFAMVVGIVTGTYSSVFVAAPILYEWDQRVKGGIFKKS
jgi:preprotein translocase subunit SecF